MEEIDFLNAVVTESNCRLLLDVNNVFVNSINHGFDAKAYLRKIPTERISYLHIAGHYEEAKDLLVDTHGASIKQDVWDLLDFTYQQHGVIPTLLERDFNIPGIDELIREIDLIKQAQASAGGSNVQRTA
jgi:uncharacterized protein